MLLCTEILFIIKGVNRIEKINIKSNDMESILVGKAVIIGQSLSLSLS